MDKKTESGKPQKRGKRRQAEGQNIWSGREAEPVKVSHKQQGIVQWCSHELKLYRPWAQEWQVRLGLCWTEVCYRGAHMDIIWTRVTCLIFLPLVRKAASSQSVSVLSWMIPVIKSDLLSQMMKTNAEVKINLYCYRYWKLIFPLCCMRELEGCLQIQKGVLWWSALCSCSSTWNI